ncbi:hypothetical protein EC991_005258 [Linnemannia zychae]|nr:hypothetical protein EC991_005258 [Linnemannia zychae]
MEETRSYRLTETLTTAQITLNHIEGQNIVSWEDIEQVFPGVKRVSNGNSVIKFDRSSSQESINCCPHSALDVVLSTTSPQVDGPNSSKLDSTSCSSDLKDAPTDPQVGDSTITALHVTLETATGNFGVLDASSSLLSNVDASSNTILFQMRASKKAWESEIEQRFISLLAPELQETVRASSDVYQAFTEAIKDCNGRFSRADLREELSGPFQKLEAMVVTKNTELQGEISALRREMNVKQEKMIELQVASDAKQEEIIRLQKEMKQMQQRALGQLSVLQSRVQAVLTQTYELHEYPIPRLFIVLPQYPSGWNIMEPFTDKYRLYFLCECGEHTKAAGSNNTIPHEIHLAKHEGYEIARPTEFFQQYGPYTLTILKMLKFGLSVANVAVPAVTHLIKADALDQAAKGLHHLKNYIGPGMDQVISKIEEEGEIFENFAEQMKNKEALEGANLRKLETFLKDKDGSKVLGNLYRTVTGKGHVKWVCMEHYRENYNEIAAKAFRRAIDAVGGSFDENNGVARVTLQSRVLSEQLYSSLGNAISVYELDINLDLEGGRSDLEALADALKMSNVSILRLDLRKFRPISSIFRLPFARYDVLYRIMEHPNMRMIHYLLPRDFFDLSVFPPRPPSHLCKLFVEIEPQGIGAKDLRLLSESLKTDSTLTTLNLQDNSIGDNGAQALAEALKINSTLTTLSLQDNSIGDNGAQALAEALKTNLTLTALNFQDNSIGDNGAQALAEALKTNSTLTILNLNRNSIGDNGAQALAEAFKTNKTLTSLNLDSNLIWYEGIQALSLVFETSLTITTLNLGSNLITVNGAKTLTEALKTKSTLTTLNLSYNSIRRSGAQALAEVLKTNSTLTTLNLTYNSIGDNGAHALAEALKTNLTLTALNLQDNSIQRDGARALAEVLKTNSTLTALNLTYNSIESNGAQELAEVLKINKTLTVLNLDRNSIGNDGAQALAEALKTNSTLITLNLDRNSIGDNGAQALAGALKTNSTLTTLNLQDNSIGDNGVQALAIVLNTNSTLATLDLTYNSIGDKGALALAEALKTNLTLTALNLTYNSIESTGAQALAEALKTGSALTTLSLDRNSIGDNGAQALAEALKTDSTLTTLNLQDNSIGDIGAQALAKAVRTNSTLTTLNLNRNPIGDNGAQALAEAYKTDKTVTIGGLWYSR